MLQTESLDFRSIGFYQAWRERAPNWRGQRASKARPMAKPNTATICNRVSPAVPAHGKVTDLEDDGGNGDADHGF